MAIRLIISDVDGCISPEESIAWDFEPFAKFCRLSRDASAGKNTLAPLTLCTGRPQPYVEALMKILDIRFPAICENGTVLYDLTHNHSRYAPGLTQEKIVGLRAVRSFIETEVLTRFDNALLQFGKEAQLSVFSKTPQIFREIKPMIEKFVVDHKSPDVVINASHFYLNISLAGIDKGSAIRHLMQELGLTRDEVAGIGDTEGDLPLRREVGFFACPANSTAEVKKVADYVAPHPTIQGVLDILEQPALRAK